MTEEALEPNEYRCEQCRGIFIKGQTDKEAIEEMNELWSKEELGGGVALVCDDCFKGLTNIKEKEVEIYKKVTDDKPIKIKVVLPQKEIDLEKQIKNVNKLMHATQEIAIQEFKSKYMSDSIQPSKIEQELLKTKLIEVSEPFVKELVRLEQLRIDISFYAAL